jgi:hypothetical protein
MSIWQPQYNQRPSSCTAPAFTEAQAAAMTTCPTDPTALDVDLRKLGDKTACLHYTAAGCSFKITDVREIRFDAMMEGCRDTWACPLWATPSQWNFPQRSSGEIDFLEHCSNNLNVSFGSDQGDYVTWQGATGLPLTGDKAEWKTYRFAVERRGPGEDDFDVKSFVCPLGQPDSPECKEALFAGPANPGLGYGYGERVKGNLQYDLTLVSDIWNGTAGDAGYAACQRQANPNSQCHYAIQHVRVVPADGVRELFAPGAPQACAALLGPATPP